MFDKAMAAFVAGISGLSILLGFLVVIPLTLWFAWAHQRIDEYSILITLFCLSFFWMFMSMLQCHRSLRHLGLDGEARMRLFSGTRSDDPDELRAWKWGWHFVYAVIAVLLCIFSLPTVSWLTGN